MKDRQILSRSHIGLHRWVAEYLEAIDRSPTSRPVTDRYYAQLMGMEISDQEKTDLGCMLFGEVILNELNKKREAIMATLQG